MKAKVDFTTRNSMYDDDCLYLTIKIYGASDDKIKEILEAADSIMSPIKKDEREVK